MFASGVAAWTLLAVVGAAPVLGSGLGARPERSPFSPITASSVARSRSRRSVSSLSQPLDLGGRMAGVRARVVLDLLRTTLGRLQQRLGFLPRRLAELLGRALGHVQERLREVAATLVLANNPLQAGNLGLERRGPRARGAADRGFMLAERTREFDLLRADLRLQLLRSAF